MTSGIRAVTIGISAVTSGISAVMMARGLSSPAENISPVLYSTVLGFLSCMAE